MIRSSPIVRGAYRMVVARNRPWRSPVRGHIRGVSRVSSVAAARPRAARQPRHDGDCQEIVVASSGQPIARCHAPSPPTLAPHCHTGDTGRSGGGREPWSAWSRSARSCPAARSSPRRWPPSCMSRSPSVRPAVLVGSVTLNAAFASEHELAAAIEAERARVRDARGPLRPARLIDVASVDALLAEADRIDSAGRLDLDTVVAIQRTVGAVAARAQERLVLILARYGTIRRVIWSRAVDAMRDGRLSAEDLGSLGHLILLWNELTSLVVTDGFPDRRARAPGSRRRGAPRRSRGAPRRHRRGPGHRRPAASGRQPVRAGPGAVVPARRDRPSPRGRPDAGAAGHRRGRHRGDRPAHRPSRRVDGAGSGGRGLRDPAAGRRSRSVTGSR